MLDNDANWSSLAVFALTARARQHPDWSWSHRAQQRRPVASRQQHDVTTERAQRQRSLHAGRWAGQRHRVRHQRAYRCQILWASELCIAIFRVINYVHFYIPLAVVWLYDVIMLCVWGYSSQVDEVTVEKVDKDGLSDGSLAILIVACVLLVLVGTVIAVLIFVSTTICLLRSRLRFSNAVG